MLDVRRLRWLANMTLSKHIRRSRDSRWCVRFKTDHPDGDTYDGIVTHVGRDFVALREMVDFELDGFVILPLDVITKVRDGKFERCGNAILRHNGAIEQLGTLDWLEDCKTLRAGVDELMNRDIWPAIEIVFDRGKRSALYLGPITRTSKKHFGIRCYDAAGRWEREYRLPYRDIFKIELESAYSLHFNSYMRSRDGAELAHAAERAQRESVLDP